MNQYLKNLEHRKIVNLASEVAYLDGQIVSKTLAQNQAHSLTLFAFAKGEEISTHASSGDALVTILDGTAKINIGSDEFIIKNGETIVMPANVPHALYAVENFKMQLIVLFPTTKEN